MKLIISLLFFSLPQAIYSQEIPLNLGFEMSYYESHFKHWGRSLNPWNYAITVDTTTAYSGTKSLCISFQEKRHPKQRSTGFYNVDPRVFDFLKGKDTLTISAYVKVDSLGEDSYATIYGNIRGGGKFNYQYPPSLANEKGQGEWQKLIVTLPITATDNSLVFGGFLHGRGKAWFDHFELSVDGILYEDIATLMPSVRPSQIKATRKKLIPIEKKNDSLIVSDKFYKIVAKARIIGLGEGTHGTHEFSVVKNTIIQGLAENENEPIIVAFESSFGAALRINDYVLHGKGDAIELVKGSISNPWRTHECLNLVNWIKTFNETHENKIMFFGFDNQWPTAEIRRLEEFANQHNQNFLRHIEGLKTFSNHFDKKLISRETSDSISRHLENISRDLSTVHNSSVSVELYRTAMQNVEILKQYFLRQQKGSDPTTTLFRDSCMAQNIVWIANNFPKRKVILWAHNAHVMKNKERMGEWLNEIFQDAYFAAGFSTSVGTYTSFDRGAHVSPLKIPHPETYEYWFDRIGYENFLLFTSDFKTKSGTNWLRKPLLMRGIGAFENDIQFSPAEILDDFDCIMHIKSTRHISHLHF